MRVPLHMLRLYEKYHAFWNAETHRASVRHLFILFLFIQYFKRSTLLANKPFYQVALYNIVKQLTYHTIIYKFTLCH